MFNSAAMFLGGRRCSSQLEIPTLYLKTDDEDEEGEIGSTSRSRRTSFESSHHHRVRHSLPLASLTSGYQRHHHPSFHHNQHPFHTHQQYRHKQHHHDNYQRPSNLDAITPSTPSTALAISPETPSCSGINTVASLFGAAAVGAAAAGPGQFLINPTPTSISASVVQSGTFSKHQRYEKHSHRSDHHHHHPKRHRQAPAKPARKSADHFSMGPAAGSIAVGPPMAASVTTAAALLHSSALFSKDNTPPSPPLDNGSSDNNNRRSLGKSFGGGGANDSASRKSQMYELPILNPLRGFDEVGSPYANCTSELQQSNYDSSGILGTRVAPNLPYHDHHSRCSRYFTLYTKRLLFSSCLLPVSAYS